MRSDESLRQEFLAAMRECEVVDTHSHTRFPDRYYAEGPYDLFSLNSYFERDIVGLLGKDPYHGCSTDEEKWERLRTALYKGCLLYTSSRTRNSSRSADAGRSRWTSG